MSRDFTAADLIGRAVAAAVIGGEVAILFLLLSVRFLT